MKLVYFKAPHGNFGDDLNEWFWERASPGLVDDDDSAILIGIGTLLQAWRWRDLPATTRKIVIGTGAGSKGSLPVFDESWTVYGVRGPLSAAYFDLGPDKILADPAILVAKFTELHADRSGSNVGFMPHVWSATMWDWAHMCRKLGLVYVDPFTDSRETIRKISGLSRLVTEAMHGAIVADAVRTPWVATSISRRFEPAKWCDWAGALGVDLHLHTLTSLHRPGPAKERLKNGLKRAAVALGRAPNHLPTASSTGWDVAMAEKELRHLAHVASPQLSDETRLAKAVGRMETALEKLRSDERIRADVAAAN